MEQIIRIINGLGERASKAKDSVLSNKSYSLFILGLILIYIETIRIAYTITDQINLPRLFVVTIILSGPIAFSLSTACALYERRDSNLRKQYQYWYFMLLVFMFIILFVGMFIQRNELKQVVIDLLVFTGLFAGILAGTDEKKWKSFDVFITILFAVSTLWCIVSWFQLLRSGVYISLRDEVVWTVPYIMWGTMATWPYFALTIEDGPIPRKFIAYSGLIGFFGLSFFFQKRITFLQLLCLLLLFAAFGRRHKGFSMRRLLRHTTILLVCIISFIVISISFAQHPFLITQTRYSSIFLPLLPVQTRQWLIEKEEAVMRKEEALAQAALRKQAALVQEELAQEALAQEALRKQAALVQEALKQEALKQAVLKQELLRAQEALKQAILSKQGALVQGALRKQEALAQESLRAQEALKQEALKQAALRKQAALAQEALKQAVLRNQELLSKQEARKQGALRQKITFSEQVRREQRWTRDVDIIFDNSNGWELTFGKGLGVNTDELNYRIHNGILFLLHKGGFLLLFIWLAGWFIFLRDFIRNDIQALHKYYLLVIFVFAFSFLTSFVELSIEFIVFMVCAGKAMSKENDCYNKILSLEKR